MTNPQTNVVSSVQKHERLLVDLAAEIDAGLSQLFTADEPRMLYEPARYVLGAGGKRFRPTVVLLLSQALGVERRLAMPVALAVEVFHNFTLVHDDIMDHAPERRGRPTVHTRWDESIAILTGDLLLARAYALLSDLREDLLSQVLPAFHATVVHLCEGQAFDKEFESRADVSVGGYEEMIRGKTGALMSFAMEAPGILAGLPAAERSALRSAGFDVGLGFQVQDDLLDLTATSAEWGKAIGGDLVEGKKTYVLLRALERTEGEHRRILAGIFENGGLHPADVKNVIEIIRESGALEEAAEKVEAHYAAALDGLDILPGNAASHALRTLLHRLRHRSH